MDDRPLGKFMPGDVATKQFKREIDAVPAGGTARIVADTLTARV
jgi:hypothetical protein